ncbi:hypothetical protein GC175_30070 [bacterium]|nr:hypothetical protein [bacterium]
MGNGYVSRTSLRTVRLILAGLLLALMLVGGGISVGDGGAVTLTPAAIAADHTGGSTGGG